MFRLQEKSVVINMKHRHIYESATKFLNLVESGSYWKLDDEAVEWAGEEGREAVANHGAGLLDFQGYYEYSTRECIREALGAAEAAGVRTLDQLKAFINWEDDGPDNSSHNFRVGDRVKILMSGPTRGRVGTIRSFSTLEGGEAAWVELDISTGGRWVFIDKLASA